MKRGGRIAAPILGALLLDLVVGPAFAFELTQKELAYMPATMQIELFKRGLIMPVDVLKAQKAQYDAHEEQINAANVVYWDDAMQQAEESAKRYKDGTYRDL